MRSSMSIDHLLLRSVHATTRRAETNKKSSSAAEISAGGAEHQRGSKRVVLGVSDNVRAGREQGYRAGGMCHERRQKLLGWVQPQRSGYTGVNEAPSAPAIPGAGRHQRRGAI